MVWTRELRKELLELKSELDSVKKWQFWKMYQLVSIMNRPELIKKEAGSL